MGTDDFPDWLPADWTVNIKKIDGRKVKCYVDSEGHKCYSKPQVFEYLKKTNKSIPNDKTQNADDSGIDLSVEPNAPHTDEVPVSIPGGHPAKLTPRSSTRKPIYKDQSEDDLPGDGSSSARSSHNRHRGDTTWLPEGWTTEDKFRKGGSSSGMKYKVYIEPVTGRKFFSRPQVLNYLAKKNSSAGGEEAIFPEPISAMPISAWQEKSTTEPDNSQTYEATEAETTPEKKTESSHLSTDYDAGFTVTSRTPAEGLPPGWIKEIRTRKSGHSKRNDPFFLDPLSDYAFCSKKDALRYLESGDIKTCVSKPRKKIMDNDDTLDVNLTSSGGELASEPDQSKETEASKEFANGSVEELKTNESGIQNPKPLRSITGGSFSTPDNTRKGSRSITGGSFSTPKEDTDWLPEGWLVDVRYKNSGMKYKIYKEPVTGKLFYSKPQVLSFLGIASSSNSRKRKEHNSVAPDSSPNTTPGVVAQTKRSVKKKDKSENSEFQEVITTSAADGLPPGWIKEVRTKIYATHKRSDPFYTDPETGYIFRSKLDASRYLETGDVNLCAIRPKVKDKDGKEVFVFTNNVQKPTAGDGASTQIPEENHTPDAKTGDNTNRRVSSRVTKRSSPLSADSPARSSKRQKGKNPETSGGPTEGQEKQATGVNLEKQPDDGNLSFDIPEDDNWTDQCIDFAVKTLTNEILFNGQPVSGGFQEENGAGVESTGAKETTPTKVN